MSSTIVNLTESTFDEEINSASKPVLVDFWAEWCGPCRDVAPILEELSTEEADRLQVAKVDVESNGGLALRFGVQSIPMLILFKDGDVAHTMVGSRGKGQLLAEISPHL